MLRFQTELNHCFENVSKGLLRAVKKGVAGKRESFPAAGVTTPKLVTRGYEIRLFGPTFRAHGFAVGFGEAERHPQSDDFLIRKRINVRAPKIFAFSKSLLGRSRFDRATFQNGPPC